MSELQIKMVDVGRIKANDYNPNAMDRRTYDALLASIKGRGFKSAIYVLPANGDGVHVLVDGEHRWRAAQQAGLAQVPAIIVPATPDEAMMDTIRMNELRGKAIPVKLALVIAELSKRVPVDVLEREMGFEEHELKDQLELLKLPDDLGKTIELQAEQEEREALAVLTFVMRKPQADLVNGTVDALEKELGGPNPRGRALDHIIRKYLDATGQPVPEEPTGDHEPTAADHRK